MSFQGGYNRRKLTDPNEESPHSYDGEQEERQEYEDDPEEGEEEDDLNQNEEIEEDRPLQPKENYTDGEEEEQDADQEQDQYQEQEPEIDDAEEQEPQLNNNEINNNNNNNNNEDLEHNNNEPQKGEEQDQDAKDDENENENENESATDEQNIYMDEEYQLIIKELKRLYGEKYDNILLKQNAQKSKNLLELIFRNIKLARERSLKIKDRLPEDADDLRTKEYIKKYNDELKYKQKYYNEERTRLNRQIELFNGDPKTQKNEFYERESRIWLKNIEAMKRIQSIQTKKVEEEIQMRQKAREVRKKHNQARLCNEIYAKVFKLEKEKHLQEVAEQNERRRRENEEKRKSLEIIRRYYTDKIELLKEILRREKRDKEIEHRAHIQFLAKLERERKDEFKKQITNILDRFDEEDQREQYNNNNEQEVDAILSNYYGN
jgi:hypothetical protein